MKFKQILFCMIGVSAVATIAACSASSSPDSPAVPSPTGPVSKPAPQPAGPATGRLKDVINAKCSGENGGLLRMNMQTGDADYHGKKGKGGFIFADNIILSSPFGTNVNDGYYSLVYTTGTFPDGSGSNIGLASFPNKILSTTEDLLAVDFSAANYVFSYEKMHCQLAFQAIKPTPPPAQPPVPPTKPTPPPQSHTFNGGNFRADNAGGCDVSIIASSSGGPLSLMASFKPPCGGALVSFTCSGAVCNDSNVMQIRILDADHFQLTDSMADQSGYPASSSYTRKN